MGDARPAEAGDGGVAGPTGRRHDASPANKDSAQPSFTRTDQVTDASLKRLQQVEQSAPETAKSEPTTLRLIPTRHGRLQEPGRPSAPGAWPRPGFAAALSKPSEHDDKYLANNGNAGASPASPPEADTPGGVVSESRAPEDRDIEEDAAPVVKVGASLSRRHTFSPLVVFVCCRRRFSAPPYPADVPASAPSGVTTTDRERRRNAGSQTLHHHETARALDGRGAPAVPGGPQEARAKVVQDFRCERLRDGVIRSALVSYLTRATSVCHAFSRVGECRFPAVTFPRPLARYQRARFVCRVPSTDKLPAYCVAS